MSRRIVLVTHPDRPDIPELADELASRLAAHRIDVDVVSEPVGTEPPPEVATTAEDAELVVVLGGDGTILRGAELARAAGIPVLGVNLGRVGFLAEAEREQMSQVVQRIADADYQVEERMTLEVDVFHEGSKIAHNWALNEASVEKAARERMLDIVVEIDGRPLSSWGADGVVMATPTGSTAYAFSAGGPIVWPDVPALLVVPISAHALFARPMVLGPDTRLAVEVVPHRHATAVMWCDGRRPFDLPGGARIEVRRGERPVKVARLTSWSFTDRLVAKFDLPVQGWRGRSLPGGA